MAMCKTWVNFCLPFDLVLWLLFWPSPPSNKKWCWNAILSISSWALTYDLALWSQPNLGQGGPPYQKLKLYVKSFKQESSGNTPTDGCSQLYIIVFMDKFFGLIMVLLCLKIPLESWAYSSDCCVLDIWPLTFTLTSKETRWQFLAFDLWPITLTHIPIVAKRVGFN